MIESILKKKIKVIFPREYNTYCEILYLKATGKEGSVGKSAFCSSMFTWVHTSAAQKSQEIATHMPITLMLEGQRKKFFGTCWPLA